MDVSPRKKPLAKSQRQKRLEEVLAGDPFSTDEELADLFGVSVQTVRLDRMAMGIPELRERLLLVARSNYQVRSLREQEIVGQLIDLDPGSSAISLLDITEDMVLARTRIARGHHLFAQANSLAAAVIDADHVLTGSARVRYKRPVRLGERVVAKAIVKVKRGLTSLVSVYSRVNNELVFKGNFVVVEVSPNGDTV